MEIRKCAWCECDYQPVRHIQLYCSKECWGKGAYRSSTEEKKEARRIADRERYLRKKDGVTSTSPRKQKQTYEAAREKARAYGPIYRQNLKAKIIAAYGGCCRKCGFTDIRALQIDHINGGGTKEHAEKKSSLGYLRIVLLAEPNTKYQILCANCNQIKRYTDGEGVGTRRTQTKHARKYGEIR